MDTAQMRPLGGFWSRKPGDRVVVITEFIASGRTFKPGEYIDEIAMGWSNFDLFSFCRAGLVHVEPVTEQRRKRA